ncbi:MAG: TlpA family protein disulfide reductase [Acidobacteria bacterium]|nr:TlpA family protein disulfide reductase [Acidobacteriota bacterium]
MMRAPEFTLRTLDGAERRLDSMRPVVLAFFKIDCPTCQLTFPYLQRIADRGLRRIVAISQDDEEGTREFHTDFKIRLETLIDPAVSRYAVSRAFGITHVPWLFEVSAEGEIVSTFSGFDRAKLDTLAGGALFTDADRVPEYKPG